MLIVTYGKVYKEQIYLNKLVKKKKNRQTGINSKQNCCFRKDEVV